MRSELLRSLNSSQIILEDISGPPSLSGASVPVHRFLFDVQPSERISAPVGDTIAPLKLHNSPWG